jgi:hypothetical protein
MKVCLASKSLRSLGMSVAIGAAQAKKLNKDKHLVLVFMAMANCKKDN